MGTQRERGRTERTGAGIFELKVKYSWGICSRHAGGSMRSMSIQPGQGDRGQEIARR